MLSEKVTRSGLGGTPDCTDCAKDQGEEKPIKPIATGIASRPVAKLSLTLFRFDSEVPGNINVYLSKMFNCQHASLYRSQILGGV